MTFIVKEPKPTGLLAAVGRTRALQPHEIGTVEHAKQVAQTVIEMIKGLGEGVKSADVKMVLIKCPLLTSAKIGTIKAQGMKPLTTDTYESMAKSRYASAVGIGLALGELMEEQVEKAMDIEESGGFWCSRASCSSGAELDDNHILLLVSTPTSETVTGKRLRAFSGYMDDTIDAEAIINMLEDVKKDGGRVLQVFVKAEADPAGTIRGMRHTMNTDSDIHNTRHARAAVGGLVAGLVRDTAVYVSGGAEGQGPSGGGSLCMVYECDLQ